MNEKMLPHGWEFNPALDFTLQPPIAGFPGATIAMGSMPFGGFSKAFEAWFQEMQRWEGLRSNHPADRGGATNRGVIWTTYQRLASKLGMPGTWDHFWNHFTEHDAKLFAQEFAKGVRAEDFDHPAVGYLIADMNWGGGAFQVRYAQRAIAEASGQSLVIDGVIGPRTVAAANSVKNGRALFDLITQYRRQAMQDIIRANPSQQVFEKGWENRIAGVYAALLPFVAKKKRRGHGSSQAVSQLSGLHWSHSHTTAPEPMPRVELPYHEQYERWGSWLERHDGVRFALLETFKDKAGRFSGRELTAFVVVAALLLFAVASIYLPVPEVVFWSLAGLAGTALVGYSIEGMNKRERY